VRKKRGGGERGMSSDKGKENLELEQGEDNAH